MIDKTDYIKRDDAIKAVERYFKGANDVYELLQDIPSADVVERKKPAPTTNLPKCGSAGYREPLKVVVEHERKRGEWTCNLEQGDPISIECPLCGATIYISGDIPDDENYLIAEDYNFCPNCGALMKEVE